MAKGKAKIRILSTVTVEQFLVIPVLDILGYV